MDKPIYIHDCPSCKFLGLTECDGKVYDLYFCYHKMSMHPTVVARYGNDPFEYTSGITFGIIGDHHKALGDALRLALKNKEYKEFIDVRVMTFEQPVYQKMYLDIVADMCEKGEINGK